VRAQAPAQAKENPRLATQSPDTAAEPRPGYFDATQTATLRALCGWIAPAGGGRPGAQEAGAAEFLDFLLSESPAPRQVLYRQGLDGLEAGARVRYGKAFAALSEAEAQPLLSPLEQPWSYAPPTDPQARFLREAKMDILRATANSRAWAEAAGGRRGAALNTYWHPVD
jgi:hypothetical protein